MKLNLNQIKIAQIALNTISELTENAKINFKYENSSIIVAYNNQFVQADWIENDHLNNFYSKARSDIFNSHLEKFTHPFSEDKLKYLIGNFEDLINLIIEIATDVDIDLSEMSVGNVQFLSNSSTFDDYHFSSDSEFEVVSLSGSITDNSGIN
ncbi:hypothetical protein [Fructobacillus ficulneus]|uniref:2-dehydropantoate 2-reductase n=1 Tax=Fructobacillus ficulneus TaxID=157463 RepID=A0A0K8MH22_9LACO|nr:hypothetical protein [Fructobacillus ficulneus]GAO99866.1 2-dehydropantoate 2-reductase [Fructobacillus ficulneus]